MGFFPPSISTFHILSICWCSYFFGTGFVIGPCFRFDAKTCITCNSAASTAEHDTLAEAEQNAMVKVEEARVSATRSVESAILKRQRAQLLMQNADMSIYKAMVALRIAEAARFTESSEVQLLNFLIDDVSVLS